MVGFFSRESVDEKVNKKTEIAFSGVIYDFCSGISVEEEILNRYTNKGMQCFTELNGKFALALLDREKKNVVLARDRIGQEPLYYHVAAEGVYFATDLAMLQKECKENFDIDMEALGNYMWNMYIPAPYSIFKQVRKVRPASYVMVNLKTGSVEETEYWKGKELYESSLGCHRETKKESKECIDDFERAFYCSVKERMPSDTTVGVYLSSGFDSTLVASVASEICDKQLHSFTIGFEEKEYNEADAAKKIAKIIGSEHHEKICSPQDAIEYLRKIPKVYSEPFADNSQIPMMMVAELASENVDVTLSGDGGDELLCGYPHYFRMDKYKKIKLISQVMKKLHGFAPKDAYDYAYWRWYKMSAMTSDECVVNADLLTALPIISRLFVKDKIIAIHSEFLDDAKGDGTFVEKYGYWGMRSPLEGDSLVKVDRATKQYGIDNRMPFLDSKLVELCMEMPIEIKNQNGLTKYPIRKLVYERVPQELMDSPKRGFGIPINRWLRAELGEQLSAYFAPEFVRKQGIFDVVETQYFYKAFCEKPSPILDRIAWTYFCFQMWWEEYCMQK